MPLGPQPRSRLAAATVWNSRTNVTFAPYHFTRTVFSNSYDTGTHPTTNVHFANMRFGTPATSTAPEPDHPEPVAEPEPTTQSDPAPLAPTPTGGSAQHTYRFGLRGDRHVVGDWDGNGRQTRGLVRSARWLLSNSLPAGTTDLTVQYGPTSIPRS